VLLGLRIKPILINFRHRFTARTANSNVLSIRSFLTSLFSLSSGGMHSTLPLEFTIGNLVLGPNHSSSRPKDLQITAINNQ
jgi:hypothetical protein